MVVVGITGQKCSGKGAVVDVLKRLGWGHISLSGIVAEELAKEGKAPSRENLIKKANELRAEEGPGVLAARAKKKIGRASGGRWVVESIRHPEEVRILGEFPDFELWRVTAPIELRYERSKKRGREENARTFEEFVALEQKENQTSGDVQRIGDCEELATVLIENEGSFDELKKKIDLLL